MPINSWNSSSSYNAFGADLCVVVEVKIYRILNTPMPPLNALTRFLLLGTDFADNMSATAAPIPYESNPEGGGGCLGFFVHSFSLGRCVVY